MNTEHLQSHSLFAVGDLVIYPPYGKCKVIAHEQKTLSGRTEVFYKLEVQKSPLSRSTKQEPAIWVPSSSATSKGLRSPASIQEIDVIHATLSSREHFFPVQEKWSTVYPQLEQTLKREGIIGITKVFSYLYVRTKREVIPAPEVAAYTQIVQKCFLREYCETAHTSLREAEDRIIKLMRPKLLADS